LYLETDIGKDITLGNIYHEYFYLRYNNKHTLVAYTEKKDVVQKKLEQCGYFCIINSVEMAVSQALIHYKSRDELQKCITDMSAFFQEQPTALTEYDESLVRLLIEKVTVYEDKFTVEFKSGVAVDVEE